MQSYYIDEINAAKAQGYHAIIMPIDCSGELHCLSDIDLDYAYQLAYEYGWFHFAMIDFSNDNISIVNLDEMEVA